MSSKQQWINSENLVPQRVDSMHSAKNQMVTHGKSPSPEGGPGVEVATSNDERNDKLGPSEKVLQKCSMANFEKKCESEGGVIPEHAEAPFCYQCLQLPRVVLYDRAEGKQELIDEILKIHGALARKVPVCYGEDFGNCLQRPESEIGWRGMLLEKKLAKLRNGEPLNQNLCCLAVESNYEICLRCNEFLREGMPTQEFDCTFYVFGTATYYRFPCALMEIADSPEAMRPSWITENDIRELQINCTGHIDLFSTPGRVCIGCLVEYRLTERDGFCREYDSMGNPKANPYACVCWDYYPGSDSLGPRAGERAYNLQGLQGPV